MKEKHLTPLEAWDKFYDEYKKPEGEPFPNELIVAQATREGRQTNKGVPKSLGVKRIRRLLDKYAPGQYDFHDGNPYFTAKPGPNGPAFKAALEKFWSEFGGEEDAK